MLLDNSREITPGRMKTNRVGTESRNYRIVSVKTEDKVTITKCMYWRYSTKSSRFKVT